VIADALQTMSVWVWVAVGVTAFLGMGIIVGFAVATILGRIAEDVLRLQDHEHWAAAPLTREAEPTDDLEAARARRKVRSSRTG
jgi:hypothetical protein